MKNPKQMTQNERKYHWFRAGQVAKMKSFAKVCPFYENLTAEYFFNCGYDGTSFEQAQALLKEKLTELLQKNPVIVESINELAKAVKSN